jgi:hypothetical protein
MKVYFGSKNGRQYRSHPVVSEDVSEGFRNHIRSFCISSLHQFSPPFFRKNLNKNVGTNTKKLLI